MTASDPVGLLARRGARRSRATPRAERLPPPGEGVFPLSDPLTVKELRGLSRNWQHYVSRVVYVGLVACVLLRWWSETTTHPQRMSTSAAANLGRTLFEIFVPGQLLLVVLAAISAASDMIPKEVRAGTLGLLDMASLSPSRIATSKWKAVVVSTSTLILAGLPVLAACIYLGGVGPLDLMWSLALTATSAAVSAAVSLRYSALEHSPLVAILKAVGVLTAVSLLLLPFAAAGGLPLLLASILHPGYAAAGILWSPPGEGPHVAAVGSILCSSAVMLRLLQGAAVLVRKRVVDPIPPPRPLNDPELFESNYRRLTRGGPRVVTVQRRIWERRELLWKEWVTRPATRLPLDARMLIAAVAGFLLWGTWVASYEGWEAGPFWVVGAGFLLLATFNGAVLFGSEKNGLKFDMLLSTPLRTSEIVLTKLASGVVTPEAGVGIVLAMAAVAGWFSGAGWSGAVLAGLTSLLFLVFAYLLGAAASLYSSTVRTAVVLSAGALGVLVIGIPWVSDLLRPAGLAAAAESIDLARVLGPFRPRSAPSGDAVRRCGIFAAVYSGLSLAILAAIFHRFRRLTGRS